MAVITRKSLQTKEAQDITDKALKQASLYNPNIANLQQQRTIIQGQQQGLLQATQETIGDVNKNIYKAQRNARAQSAALGMVGSVDAARSATELQDQIGYELGNIVSQANQGAISIASQQSAINEAEVMNAQQEILNIYADELIESGDSSVQQDIGAQVAAGIGGAFTGALAGAGIGGFAPKISHFARKTTLRGTGVGVVGGLIANTALTKVGTIGKDYWSKESQESYDDSELTKRGSLYAGIGGAAIGASLQKIDKYALSKTTGLINLPDAGRLPRQKGFWTTQIGKGTGKFKAFSPTPLTLAMAGIGGIVGGLSAGLDKKYKLDYDQLMQSGTAQDFAQMGIDLNAMNDIIKGK